MNEKGFSLTSISKFRVRRIAYIALFWMLIDLVIKLLDLNFPSHEAIESLALREVLVFFMSLVMGYMFVYTLPSLFIRSPLIVNFFAKSLILLLAALLMNFIVHFLENITKMNMTPGDAVNNFFVEMLDRQWLIKKTLYWIVLFIVTQLYLEINDKYSPGVFLDILKGKYTHPKVERRIVMFMDLKDSTPIAERLGHERYFLFIRDFIHDVSLALIEKGGIIYQYVGDEIVVSWTMSPRNVRNCLTAILVARKNIQKKSARYRRKYDTLPEFRIGIHVGEVTVGEIGVIKKDLAMSGDIMNTAARIRSVCADFNEKFIVSKEFYDKTTLKDFQVKDLGTVDLKGKAASMQLFALKF